VLGAAERGSRDRVDGLNVAGELTSDHHHGTVDLLLTVVNAFSRGSPTTSPYPCVRLRDT
jgi:hypothetical protein